MASVSSILTAPLRIGGPILRKELRVASRQKRTYAMRCAYLALLTLIVALVWMAEVRTAAEQVYGVSRMAQAGKTIIGSIVWFQFLAIQLVAVVLLAPSISTELRHRTLGVLMTTPVRCLQIVFGKLLSQLWQLIILLAVSLPLLAVVRIFGGVPWSFVAAGLCISLTAALAAGAVAMFFSALFRPVYAGILLSLATGFVLYLLLPTALVWLLITSDIADPDVLSLLGYANPFLALQAVTVRMAAPLGRLPSFYWPIHCLVMLGGAMLFLVLTAVVVRGVTMRRAISATIRRRDAQAALPPPSPPPPRTPPREMLEGAGAKKTPRFVYQITATALSASRVQQENAAKEGKVRTLRGSPLLWHELRSRLFGSLAARIAMPLVAALVLVISYAVCDTADALGQAETQGAFAFLLVAAGTLATAVLAATGLANEKESHTLSILLTTPLNDWHIILAKAVGVLRRCAPVWLLLVAHTVLFFLPMYTHPLALLHLLLLAAGVWAMLTGTGLYFSACFRRTTSAVLANLGLALGLWVLLPILLGLLTAALHPAKASAVIRQIYDVNLMTSPAIEGYVVMEGASGKEHILDSSFRYDWPGRDESLSAAQTTARVLLILLAEAAIGLGFAWRARYRLRRNVF